MLCSRIALCFPAIAVSLLWCWVMKIMCPLSCISEFCTMWHDTFTHCQLILILLQNLGAVFNCSAFSFPSVTSVVSKLEFSLQFCVLWVCPCYFGRPVILSSFAVILHQVQLFCYLGKSYLSYFMPWDNVSQIFQGRERNGLFTSSSLFTFGFKKRTKT